jgi:hypothetical protein
LHRQQLSQFETALLEAVRVAQLTSGLLESEFEQFTAEAVDLFGDICVS